MFFERLLTLATAAFFAATLGVGLMLIASGVSQPVAETLAGLFPGVYDTAVTSEPEKRIEAATPPDRGAARLIVERQIESASDYVGYFAKLRESFAADYESTLDAFATEMSQTGRERSVDFYLSEAVRRLRQSRGAIAAKADSEAMAHIFDKQLEILRAAAKDDARMCVAFLYGATTNDFERFAAPRRALMAEMALAGLEAIISGQEKTVLHEAPNDADFKLLENTLASRGLDKPEIDALLDGKAPNPPLEDARLCGAGQTYFEVLKTLPEPARSRVYGLALTLMAKS